MWGGVESGFKGIVWSIALWGGSPLGSAKTVGNWSNKIAMSGWIVDGTGEVN